MFARVLLALLIGSAAGADTFGVNPDARRRGHIWIVDQGAGKVLQVDRKKGVIREQAGLGMPRDIDLLANGNFLVGGLDKSVAEIDRQGKIVWSYTARKAVYSIKALKNGNVLVGEHDAITEVTRDGKITWEYLVRTCPEDLVVLPGGNLLIARYGGEDVMEVNREQKVVWTLKPTSAPMAIQSLENGNILVSEVGGQRLGEWDRTGRLVREFPIGANCPSGYLTRRGTYLVSTWQKVMELDKDMKEIWTGPEVKQCVRAREF